MFQVRILSGFLIFSSLSLSFSLFLSTSHSLSLTLSLPSSLDGVSPYCLFQFDSSTTFGNIFFYIPLVIAIVFGDIFFSNAILNLLCNTTNCAVNLGDTSGAISGRVSPLQTMSSRGLKALLLLFVVFVTFWVSVFVFKFQETQSKPELLKSFKSWVVCLFTNFDAADRGKSRAVCGNLPAFTVSFSFSSWAFLWLTCHSFIVPGIYLPGLWITHFSTKKFLSKKSVAPAQGSTPVSKENTEDDELMKNNYKSSEGGNNLKI